MSPSERARTVVLVFSPSTRRFSELDRSAAEYHLTVPLLEGSGLSSRRGSRHVARRMLGWTEQRKINLLHNPTWAPMQNGSIESFHGKFREECLNEHWFRTLDDARETIESWRIDYSQIRPHGALGYRTPEEFAMGYANVESSKRYPHSHSPDYDGGEMYSLPN